MRGRTRVHAVGRYGVYLCPGCGEPFSRETKVKRTRCPRCGKPVDVQKLLAISQTDDPAKAAEGVRYANLVGHKRGKAAAAHRDIEAGVSKPSRARHDYSAFVAAIDELPGAFTLERLRKELKGFTPQELERYLARAAEEGLLVVAKGGYRAVR